MRFMSEMTRSCGSSVFSVSRNPPCVLHHGCDQFTFPKTLQKGSLFSMPSPAFRASRLFEDGHSGLCEVNPGCSVSFNLQFSNN